MKKGLIGITLLWGNAFFVNAMFMSAVFMSAVFMSAVFMSTVFMSTAFISTVFMSTAARAAVGSGSFYTVAKKSNPDFVTLDGVVEPVNQGTLAAQTSGRIVGVYADVNDYVKAGSVVLEISATQQTASFDEASAQLSQAAAQNREAQAQLQRYQQLYPKGVVTPGQMDSAQAQARSASAAVKAAKAAVTKAKDALGYTSVRAPYDGIVTSRYVELGETVAPGTPLISGYGLHPLRVTTEIPQRYYQFLKNQKEKNTRQFEIEFPEGSSVQPVSYSLFRYLDTKSHTATLRLNLPETNTQELTPGMWVKVRFSTGERMAVFVPQKAVVYRGEVSAVYRRTVDGLRLTPIRQGSRNKNEVEILAGLEEGDEILIPANREGE